MNKNATGIMIGVLAFMTVALTGAEAIGLRADAADDKDPEIERLTREVNALKLQVAELQQIVRQLRGHMSQPLGEVSVAEDPALDVVADNGACEGIVEKLQQKLHAMRSVGYTDRHPDVRQLSAHLDQMKGKCSGH